MKIMIVGHARHGKDTAADVLGRHLGCKPLASSWVACETFLFDELTDRGFRYFDAKTAWDDRLVNDKMRALWFELIKKYNDTEKTRLMRDIYNRSDIYNGLRNHEELLAGYDAKLIDLCIWIDASGRLPAEPTTSMTVTPDMADIVIENNGTQAQFQSKLERFVHCLKPRLTIDDVMHKPREERIPRKGNPLFAIPDSPPPASPCPGCQDPYHPGVGKRCPECGYTLKAQPRG